MKVKIEIEGNNAAFEDCENYEEYRRIIQDIADFFATYSKEGETNLRDINGNVCGFIEITEG